MNLGLSPRTQWVLSERLLGEQMNLALEAAPTPFP